MLNHCFNHCCKTSLLHWNKWGAYLQVFVWIIKSKWALFYCSWYLWSRKSAHCPENHLGNEMFQLVLLEWKRARLAFCILTFEETCWYLQTTFSCMNSICVMTECYVKQPIHTFLNKESILDWPCGCQFTDQKKILVMLIRVSDIVFDSPDIPGCCKVINSQSQPDVHLPH